MFVQGIIYFLIETHEFDKYDLAMQDYIETLIIYYEDELDQILHQLKQKFITDFKSPNWRHFVPSDN